MFVNVIFFVNKHSSSKQTHATVSYLLGASALFSANILDVQHLLQTE